MNSFLKRHKLIVQLVLLVLFSISLQLVFFSGPVYQESYTTTKGGYELLSIFQNNGQGLLQANGPSVWHQIRNQIGFTKLISYAPFSLIFFVGGVSDFTSGLFPLVMASLNLIFYFLIVRNWLGEKTALISAFLWAFLPQGILLATIPRLNSAFLSMVLGGVFVFVEGQKRKSSLLMALGLITCLPLLFLDTLLGLYIFTLCLVYLAWQLDHKKMVWLGMFIAFAIVLFVFGPNTLVETYMQLALSHGGVRFLVVFVIALSGNFLVQNKPVSFSLVWLILSFLVIVIRNQAPSIYELPYEFEILLWGTMLIAIAEFLSFNVEELLLLRFLIVVIPITVILATQLIATQDILLPDYRNLILGANSAVLLLLEILAGIAIILASVRAFFLDQGNNTSTWLALGLLACFSLSLLPGALQQRPAQTYQLKEVREFIAYLNAQDADLPVYVHDPLLFDLMDYAHGFSKETDVVLFEKKNQIDNGFIVVREGGLGDFPSNWLQMNTFGSLHKPRLTVYRVLQEEIAQPELAIAQQALLANQSSENLVRIYQASINTDDLCSAYQAWRQAKRFDENDALKYILVDTSKECFPADNEVDLLGGLIKPNDGNSFSEPGIVYSNQIRVRSFDETDAVRIFHLNKFYPDPRIFDLRVLLEPGKLYLYEATVRSNLPVTSLYWSVDGEEFAALIDDFPAWRRIAVLIATPDWDEPNIAKFSPVLFDHYDFVDLRDVRLVQLNPSN